MTNLETRMTKIPLVKLLLSILIVICVFLLPAAEACACSVCQGNPDSDLAKGAQAGILLMVGVTYTVLFGFVGLVAFWFVRGKNLRQRTLDSLL